MEYIGLLGSHLKCDFLLDLFKTYDVEVLYRYDRNHEGMDDEYVAEIPDMGLEFLFDSTQCVTALFLKKVVHSGYNPFQGSDPRSAPFKTGVEAIKWAEERSIDAEHQESMTDEILGVINEWVNLRYETHNMHFQFHDGAVSMVTLHALSA